MPISKLLYDIFITAHFSYAAWSVPVVPLMIIPLFVMASAVAEVYAPAKSLRNMSVVALLYFAISPLLSKRYEAKSRYYTWVIIAAGFLVPFRFRLPTPIIGVQTAILGEVPIAEMIPAAAVVERAMPIVEASRRLSLLCGKQVRNGYSG